MGMFKTGLLLTFLGLGIAKGADAVNSKTSDYNAPKSTSTVSVQKSIPNAQTKQKKLEFEVGVFNEQNSANPIDDWSRHIDEKFRNGDYTSTSDVSDWKGISVPSNISMNGLEVSCNKKLSKKFSAGLNVGYKESKNNSTSYEGVHVVDNITTDFNRSENYGLTAPFIGIKGKLNLSDKLAMILAGNIESINTKGSMRTTIHRQDNGNTKWYDATFEGNANASTLEIGAEYKPSKKFSAGISAGSKTGKIDAKGKSIVSTNVSPYTVEKEYNPNLNLDNSFVKLILKYHF